jgi:hypothetical protein
VAVNGEGRGSEPPAHAAGIVETRRARDAKAS